MTATITLRAVHRYGLWHQPDPDADGDLITWTDWMDPESPLVHWSTRCPFDLDDPDETFQHDEGEPVDVELDLVRAARLIADWPGEVWDRHEGEWSTINYSTGVEHLATLFIHGTPEAVEAVNKIADRMEAWRDQQLRQLRERTTA